jgi:sulfur-carrier protein adenylyltransferase/sulfurtransferase
MAVTVLIPTPLRPYVGGQNAVSVEAASIGELLRRLSGEHVALRQHLFAEDGRLRNFVNVYVNDRDIRQLSQQETPLGPGDTVSIIPSIAGGTAVAEALPALSHEEILRYSRHLILPDVGVEGQKRLKAARVLLVGAGGLGSPAALYLAAAGVGTIGLVDFDTVDLSNLQRQIIHKTDRVGILKTESAQESIKALNPGIKVIRHDVRLSSDNVMDVIKDYDVIVNCGDNFPTRYLINDACVFAKKPLVDGAIFRFEGNATVFYPAAGGPCYRCLYPEPAPPDMAPSCAEAGVLGALPGVIGSIEALEAIKLLLGAGKPLVGRMVYFDTLSTDYVRILKIRRNPDCPVCSEHPTQTTLIDYEAFCGLAAPGAEAGATVNGHVSAAAGGR